MPINSDALSHDELFAIAMTVASSVAHCFAGFVVGAAPATIVERTIDSTRSSYVLNRII